MRTLILFCDRMKTRVLQDVLEDQSYKVIKHDLVDEALRDHAKSPFELVLLCDTDEETVSFIDRVHEGQDRDQCMIIALLENGDTSCLKSTLFAKIDDCFEVDSSPEIIRSRLRFIKERASIRSRHIEKDVVRTKELERINAELTETVDEYGSIQSALSESEAKVRAILETTVDGIITIDMRGRIETFNRAAELIFGYESDEVLENDVSMLMPESNIRPHDHYIGSYLETGIAKIIGIGREVLGRRKDGSEFPLELSVSELQVSGRRLFTGIVRDITERRRMEQELLRISELERRRIGQDLHDGLGQAITGIGLISQSLAKKMRPAHPEEANAVDELTRLVREADQLARDIARNLVPVEVESNGLSFALKRLASNSARLFDIECSFNDPAETLIQNNSVATHLYRIAQEAVSNAVRHGSATKVEIRLESDKAHLILTVSDNGTGIDEEKPQISSGMGLGIMQYRSRMIRGYFSLLPNQNGGVDVRCRVSKENLNRPISVL